MGNMAAISRCALVLVVQLIGANTPITYFVRSYTVDVVFTLSHKPLLWRHNGLDGVSNHQPHDCVLQRLFRRRSKKASKLRVTGPCEGNSPVTGEFPAQRASNAENVSIWWRHHASIIISWSCFLTSWGWNKKASDLQTIFSSSFSSMKIVVLELILHWNLFQKAQLIMVQWLNFSLDKGLARTDDELLSARMASWFSNAYHVPNGRYELNLGHDSMTIAKRIDYV